MPTGLRRIVGRGDLHFITFCCYHRRPLLRTTVARNLTTEILGQVRADLGFGLVGYVLMPDHLHLLVDECGAVKPAQAMETFKQRVSCRLRGVKVGVPGAEDEPFWPRRYYDFNVYSEVKLHYLYANPVRGKLVSQPGDWPWSSWSFYYWAKDCWPWILGSERS
jgi:putative transposase